MSRGLLDPFFALKSTGTGKNMMQRFFFETLVWYRYARKTTLNSTTCFVQTNLYQLQLLCFKKVSSMVNLASSYLNAGTSDLILSESLVVET
jgi:hypothetical protein